MFGEIRASNFFKVSQGQRAEADLKGSGGPCPWEKGSCQCQLPRWILSCKHHVVTCPEPHLHISFYPLSPFQGYNYAKFSHFQLSTYLFAYFYLILVETRNFSHGFQE